MSFNIEQKDEIFTSKVETNLSLQGLHFSKQIGYFLMTVQVSLLCFFTVLWIRCCASAGPDPVVISETVLVPEPTSFFVEVCSNLRRKSTLNFQASKISHKEGMF